MAFSSHSKLLATPMNPVESGSRAALNSEILLRVVSVTPSDRLRFLGNCPPTPPLSHHFALSEK